MNKSLQTLDVNLRQTKTKSDLAKLRSSGFVQEYYTGISIKIFR